MSRGADFDAVADGPGPDPGGRGGRQAPWWRDRGRVGGLITRSVRVCPDGLGQAVGFFVSGAAENGGPRVVVITPGSAVSSELSSLALCVGPASVAWRFAARRSAETGVTTCADLIAASVMWACADRLAPSGCQADRAGLAVSDVIVGVGGKSLLGYSGNEVGIAIVEHLGTLRDQPD